MNVVFVFFTAVVVGYSGALVPGPMFTLVLAESAEHGSRSGLLIAAGHAVLEAAVLVGLAVGLNQVLALSWVTGFISIAGGLVMLCMGVLMSVRAARGRMAAWFAQTEGAPAAAGLNVRAEADGVGRMRSGSIALRARRPITQREHLDRRATLRLTGLGVVVSLSNPFFLLWWATIGSAYFVSAAIYGIPGITAFFLGHILADFTWFGFVGHMTAYGRRFFSPKIYRGLIMGCGLALAGVAVYFMIRGVSGL